MYAKGDPPKIIIFLISKFSLPARDKTLSTPLFDSAIKYAMSPSFKIL